MSAPQDAERRRFLQLMAASAALASGACSGPPPEFIVPYVDTPPELAHDDPLFYATAYTRGGYAHGVLVESHFGRATKVEGNPDHPASLGGTDVFAQASVLELWDPERSRAVYNGSVLSTWSAFEGAWLEHAATLESTHGAGLRILTGPITSTTLIAQIERVLARYPQAKWHSYSPIPQSNRIEGARLAFGRSVDSVLKLDQARVIVSLDCDFLMHGPGAVRYGRDFAAQRAQGAGRVRLYALEASATLTGANADERLLLTPNEVERVIWRIAALLGTAPKGLFAENAQTAQWEVAVARALRENAGASLVIAGERMMRETHALVHRMNVHLGNIDDTVSYIEPVAKSAASLRALVDDMNALLVKTLVVIGANAVYETPGTLEFGDALKHVAFSVHSGLYRDETARRCTWHLPAPHDYERWSDARAYDGTLSIVQPVMRPLYDTRSAEALLARIATDVWSGDLAITRATHHSRSDAEWHETVRGGVVKGSAAPPLALTARAEFAPPKLEDAPLVAVFERSARTDDGRYGNNAWLQELPQPLTQLVWDNALALGPATARDLDVTNGDVVRVSAGERVIECPVWIMRIHPEGVATLPLGYGRTAAGAVGDGVGFNAYPLMSEDAAVVPVSIQKAGRAVKLVTAQVHMDMHGREQVRSATLTEFTRNPHFANDEAIEKVPEVSLYPEYTYPTYAWGMAIDLNACIGCGACTIACQAENNIPVVGKAQVDIGREMHWIRVDHYDAGLPDAAREAFMPVPCMHCENAPCEEVCPVEATLHDSEGLNLQVYNRCIGTCFCNQNCPYKVRRFNFLQYSDKRTPEAKAMRNPEVTVRQRGVMEKCTYCIQRISYARIEAQKHNRRIRDGEMVTACQAACPTRAIHFGDLNDPQSAVRKVKTSPLNYTLLAELNTRPRTTYLARVVNRDPALETKRG